MEIKLKFFRYLQNVLIFPWLSQSFKNFRLFHQIWFSPDFPYFQVSGHPDTCLPLLRGFINPHSTRIRTSPQPTQLAYQSSHFMIPFSYWETLRERDNNWGLVVWITWYQELLNQNVGRTKHHHTKDHHKNGTNCLAACVGSTARLSEWSGSVWNCLWGHAHKRSPGIIRKSRVPYPVPGFLSSATWPSIRCRKSTIMD